MRLIYDEEADPIGDRQEASVDEVVIGEPLR